MNYADIHGVAMRYRRDGNPAKPPLVLIHEMGGTLESWDGVVPFLADDFHILRYDFRGAGQSEKIRAEVHVEQFADDLLGLLDHVGLTGKVGLAGVAVGAAIGLCFSGRYGDRIAALAAMSPAIDCKPEDRHARLAWIDTIPDSGMRAIAEGALGNGYPKSLRDVDPARFETFRARWIGNDPVSFAWTYRMLVHMDIRETIARIRCPTLGIGGTLDTFRPPEYVRSVLSPIPKLEFAEIETSHHQPTQTPEAIGVLLHRFFAGHAAGHVEGAAR